MTEDLPRPDFDRPPVVETALGIQFADLDRLSVVHLGLYGAEVEARYPIFEQRAKLARISESFSTREEPTPLWTPLPITPRAFFYSPDRTRLVQLQSDRFGFNWRASSKEPEYPRYAENIKLCLQEFEGLCAFCQQHSLGDVIPDLCEVVYVNHIRPAQGETAIGLMGEVFPALRWTHSTPFLPEPENATLNRVYRIPQNRGRLYAEASIARGASGESFVQLKMTARVLHAGGAPAVRESLDLAHSWVVNGFVSLTDPNTRATRWGQME